MAQNEPAYDCQRCGACCVQHGPDDGAAYVFLDWGEARRLRRLGLPVLPADQGGYFLGARRHEGAGGRPACVAFAGQLGGPCGCSIYEDRPDVCRQFEAGEAQCREARQAAGLPI